MKIGFIGLGNMGRPMAQRLLNAGHNLVVYDVNRSAADALIDGESQLALSPKNVADQVETVFLSLPTPSIVDSVLSGQNGVDRGSEVKRIFDFSTIGSKSARLVAEKLRKRDIVYIDAPVSGGTKGAIDGTLALMLSGSKADIDIADEPLKVLGKSFYIGEKQGIAQTMKLANNFLSATAILATSEAIVSGVACGLDARLMIDVINAGSGRNSASQDKFPRSVLTRRFDGGFATGLMAKDLSLFGEEIADLGIPVDVARAVIARWSAFLSQRGPDSDFTEAVIPLELAAGIQCT